MRVRCGQGRALDHRKLRGQLTVDVQQEAFHVQFGQQGAHRALLDDLAVVDDRQVAAQVLGFFQVLRGEDDRGAGRVDLLEHAPHVAADLDVHAGGRLVQDQQARAGHHRARDHQPALHAAGQAAELGVAVEVELGDGTRPATGPVRPGRRRRRRTPNRRRRAALPAPGG
ncbi:hypothetical protein G6F68_014905 [Rhizopus microsporus]|nr:hypothetical protein G6F68_014905 [Rhizopus microsporus]